MIEKKTMFIIDILKNIIAIYFDTFFVFYFFRVANYEVLPLAKYYLIVYICTGIGFFAIRNAMKRNIHVPYFRIGISLQALYIAVIMILKDNIINHIFLVGLLRGIADGFYHFPKNIMNSEKIDNESRQKYSGFINTINKINAIIIPLLLGYLLTYIDYTNLGKAFFILFIIMFFMAFKLTDKKEIGKKFEFKKFWKLIKKNKDIRYSLYIPLLSGLTYSSGVMGTIITLFKINNFKTNLNLGYVDSLCAVLSLITCVLYTTKLNKKRFKNATILSGITSFVSLMLIAFLHNRISLIIYLIIRFSFVIMLNLISSHTTVNITNSKDIKENFKSEYFCFRDIAYSISRSFGFLILILVSYTKGISNISYILILPGFSLIFESLIVSKLCKKYN